jgi:serine/threonine-protein kinase
VVSAQVNTLGRYEILGELGRGAISVVYDARDLLTDEPVVLKLIEPTLWVAPTSAAERLRFLTEAMPQWRLKHAHIVTVHDAGDGDGRLYIAMERLAGRTLRRMLDAAPRPGVVRSLRIAAEVASGLAHAHARGVVHRYLKPSNVFILADGRARITDFGMAPLRDAALASPGHAACLAYLSPEEIRCEAALDARTDIFALGAVLYEMLTGTPPFRGGSPAEIMRNVLEFQPPPPSQVDPDVPRAVDLLVGNLLAKNPDDRVSDAEAVARHLRALSDELDGAPAGDGVTARPATTAGARAQGDRRAVASRWAGPRVATAVLIAVIFAAAGSAFLWQWRQHPDSSETHSAAISHEPPAAASTTEAAVADAPRPAASEPKPKARASKAPPRRPSPAAVASGGTPARPQAAASASSEAPAPGTQPSVAVPGPPRALAQTKTATLVFDVSPWGEIYVDGELQGTTPPVTTLGLPPGRYLIEVRNSAQLPYLSYATLGPGDVQRIRHGFE